MAAVMPFVDINLHASDTHYAFSSPSNPTAPSLVVDRPSGDLRLVDGKISGAHRVSSIAGILGIIKLHLDKYLVVAAKSKPVGKIRGCMIYKVVATELLPLRERPLHDHDEDSYLTILRNNLNAAPMYFSYAMDLTNSFQRQAKMDSNLPLWQRADDRFFWNKFISTDLIQLRTGTGSSTGYRLPVGPQEGVDPFILPVISGMLNLSRTSIKGQPLSYVLITRRSRHRTGTRYFSRGIDEDGNVSNFNETEQIIVLNDSDVGLPGASNMSHSKTGAGSGREVQILSYVQTRGSVPVYWAEVNKLKYTPELQIRGIDSAVNAAKLHFEEQIRTYGDNYLVNLVNAKGREKRVKDAYEQMVRILQSSPGEEKVQDSRSPETVRILESGSIRQQFDRLHYVYFDFHNETKGLKWHRVQVLLDTLSEPLSQQQYFHGVYNLNDRAGRVEVRNYQRSVVRTNCMDCLDRTNVVQSMLGRVSLNRMLQDLQIIEKNETAQDDARFEHLFRNIWADNADVVSRSYSGTGALKTDFTRTGNRTKAGALQDLNNSITRYIKNNFADGPRQDGFDLFSGAYLPSSSKYGSSPLFIDRRPLIIQSIPFLLLGSIFFVFVALVSRRLPDATVWPLRISILVFLGIAAYCANFMWTHGALYVNWPKLNTPSYAVEGFQDALGRLVKDPVLGPLVRHERGKSDGRLGYLEEGKKRIE